MEFIRKNYQYGLCFLFVFLVLIFLGYPSMDTIWNYGCSVAITRGEIPYVDFSLLVPPLYSYFMSIFLLFSKDYTFYLIGQAILVTICYYFIDQMEGKKCILLLPFLGLGYFSIFFPTYNFLAFFFFILLLYMEKNKKSNFSIGVVLGLLLLSKHTIAFLVILASFLSTHSIKMCFRRFLGILLPSLFFVFYLVYTHSFSSFLDLGIFGLFDFGHSNTNYQLPFFILSIFLFLFSCFFFIQNKEKYESYYLLSSFSFLLPIVDLSHFQYVFVIFCLIVILPKLSDTKWVRAIFIISSCFSCLFLICYHSMFYRDITISKLNYFSSLLVPRELEEEYEEVLSSYQKQKNAYMFSFSNMIYDIASNRTITYFDMPLNGNYGYLGISKMKKRISSMHDVYFYVENHNNSQFSKEIYSYIVSQGEFVSSISSYDIYYIE